MIVKYFVDATTGRSLGGFGAEPPYTIHTPQPPVTNPETGEEVPQDDLIEIVTPEVIPPPNSVEVPAPPENGFDTWDFKTGTWIPHVPLVIYPPLSRRQLLLMLLNIGIEEADVDAELLQIADDFERKAAMIEWRGASEFKRTHTLIDQMGAAFSLPSEHIDSLWLAAAEL